MNLRLRRRRFGQLAVVSAAIAVVGNFAKKTLAQTSPLLYGVRYDPKGKKVIVQSLDLATGQITDTSALASNIDLQDDERLSSFTFLANGTFTLFTAPNIHKPGINVNLSRGTDLASANPLPLSVNSAITSTPLPVSSTITPLKPQPLPANSTSESLIQIKDGSLLSILSLNQGVPPFRLATIDRQTGGATFRNDFDVVRNFRLSNLAQSSDGKIYATALGSESSTRLVQIDLVNRSIVTGKGQLINLPKLKFKDKYLSNDVLSLVTSPAGELYVLADPTFERINSVFKVDVKTGELTLLKQFNVEKIAFAP